MKTDILSPAERIADMKRRVEEKKAREKETERRLMETSAKAQAVMRDLTQAIASLIGLPLREDADNRASEVYIHVAGHVVNPMEPSRPPYIVRVLRSFMGNIPFEQPSLFEVTIRCDPSSGDAWIEHDGDRITIDQAIDLAVAAVEARLDA